MPTSYVTSFYFHISSYVKIRNSHGKFLLLSRSSVEYNLREGDNFFYMKKMQWLMTRFFFYFEVLLQICGDDENWSGFSV